MKLVLLHGFTGHASSWDRVVERLPSDTRVFRPCLLGHDPATVGLRVRSFEDEVDRIAEAVRAERLEGARVAGYSMGARIALGLVVRHPSLWSSAVLIGVHPGLAERSERAARMAADDEWAALLEREGIERFVEAWELLPIFGTQHRLAESVREAHRARRLAHDPRGLAAAMRVLGLGRMPALESALGRAQVPVRLVAGELDRKFVELSRRLAAELPHVEPCVVRGAGHDTLVEDPGATAAAIAAPPENPARKGTRA